MAYLSKKEIEKFIKILLVFIILGGIIFIVQRNLLDNVKAKDSNNIDYQKENYVFLGDSITDYYNLDTYYGDLPTVNSGTSGFQTVNILYGLEQEVYVYNPTKVFLLIGTNDIAFTKLTNEEIVKNIEIIINEIKYNRPLTEIYIQSIYPVNKNTDNDIVIDWMVGNRSNDRIKEINKMIKRLCEEKKVTYIDMYKKLEDNEGNLKLDYTIDGLHISEEGYEVITDVIMNYIESSD